MYRKTPLAHAYIPPKFVESQIWLAALAKQWRNKNVFSEWCRYECLFVEKLDQYLEDTVFYCLWTETKAALLSNKSNRNSPNVCWGGLGQYNINVEGVFCSTGKSIWTCLRQVSVTTCLQVWNVIVNSEYLESWDFLRIWVEFLKVKPRWHRDQVMAVENNERSMSTGSLNYYDH